MAQKKQASQKSETNVTRIKATDTKPTVKTNSSKTTETTAVKQKKSKRPVKGIARPFVAIGRYFKGAWFELKQVRWPTRKATWSLTLAVLIYTAFFVVLVILLDIGFKYLFDIMLGK